MNQQDKNTLGSALDLCLITGSVKEREQLKQLLASLLDCAPLKRDIKKAARQLEHGHESLLVPVLNALRAHLDSHKNEREEEEDSDPYSMSELRDLGVFP